MQALEEARRAHQEKDWPEAARAYAILLERGDLPSEDLEAALESWIQADADEYQAAIEAMLRVAEQDPQLETLRICFQARFLEARNGRKAKDARERYLAHHHALSASESEAQRASFWKGLFRAQVRLSELECGLPEVEDPSPFLIELRAAAEAHARWRKGGDPKAASESYCRALDHEARPEALEPYLLFWASHLKGVAEDFPGALEGYRRLLEVGPPGKGGREDIERRMKILEDRLSRESIQERIGSIESARDQGDLEHARELAEAWIETSSGEELVEALQARAQIQVAAGDLAGAVSSWEEVQEVQPERARVPLRSLRRRLEREVHPAKEASSEEDDGESEPARSELGSAPPQGDTEPEPEEDEASDPWEEEPELEQPEEEREPPPREAPRSESRQLSLRRANQEIEDVWSETRHQEDLARRLDAAGEAREAVLGLRQAYLDLPPGPQAETLRKRAAAMAWHRLRDPVLTAEALFGLSPKTLKRPDISRLVDNFHSELVDTFRRDIRLGLRRQAFRGIAALFRNLHVSEPLRRELFQLHLESLSSCVYQSWKLRHEQVSDSLGGFRSRGFGAWNLVKLPEEVEGSPEHMKALEEELSILNEMGKVLKAREWAVLRLGDEEGQARRLEDAAGIRAMDAILQFVAEVAYRRVRHEVQKPVAGWRDKIASWLPEAARDLVLTDSGKDLLLAREDLIGQFEAFLDLKYQRAVHRQNR